MSSTYFANQQQISAVQAIFSSLARCVPFINDEEGCQFSCPSTKCRMTPVVESPPRTTSTPPEGSRGSSDVLKTQAQSQQQHHHPPSQQQEEQRQSLPKQQQQQQYDADRYLPRKLQIFRTTEEECLAEFGVSFRNKAQPSSQTKSHRRDHRHSSNTNNTLLASYSDDEIDNLTEYQTRISAHGTGDRRTSFFQLLRDPFSCIPNVQRQYKCMLCHATPVRSALGDNFADLPDWTLTDNEFTAKYGGVDDSSIGHSDRDEKETITSESYFDQKYSHVVQVTAPTPLFEDYRVVVSEREIDALVKLGNVQQECNTEMKNNTTEPQQAGSVKQSKHTAPRSSAADHIVSVITTTPRKMKASLSRRSKKVGSPQIKAGKYKREYDSAPTGKCSSELSSKQSDELDSLVQAVLQHHHRHPQQSLMKLREPDIVHTTVR